MARFGSDKFQVRHGEPQNVGEYAITGFPYPLGLAMDAGDEFTDVDGVSNPVLKPAGANGYMGFLSDKVVEERDLADMMLESPDLGTQPGNKIAVERYPPGSQLEVECAPSIAQDTAQVDGTPYLLVTTGTGDVTSITANEAKLGMQNGRWREAQTGDRVCGRLLKHLTPKTAGNVRLLIEIVEGAIEA